MSLLSRLAVQAARAYGVLSVVDKNRVSADYLVVAGGGSGGYNPGGGGGAGGLLTSTTSLSTLNTYSITVGAGGAANGLTGASQGFGNQGSNSVISGTGLSTITSLGGGYGGAGGSTGSGGNGGSGGGAGGAGTVDAVGLGTSGQGNNGGTAAVLSGYWAGGGGGGAGAVGGNAISTGGVGGNGIASSISGSSVTYAGGGGGSGDTRGVAGGAGGNGGGGLGGGNGTTSVAGTANTGGGGGGGSYNGAISAAGGSGIVIISYTSATPKFVGGTITTSGGKQIHTFTSSGTLSPITPITASYLVVAGGGGSARQLGGYAGNGGGGAGGLLSGSTTIYSGATYVVTVGAGGAGGTTSGVAPSGSNSVLSGTGLTTLTSTGGGGGGGSTGTGANGGSGGGGSGELPRTAGTGTSGQGNNGGAGVNAGGGGGGAGAAGSVAVTITGGAGGIGTQSSISGTATYYAGGGGGGAYSSGTAGTGGSGGGGNGGAGASNTGNTPGTANTGGGAGGTAGDPLAATNGQTGGSGIVIISYAGSQVFNGGLVTTSGGNTIHTFTSTGALTPLTNNLNNSLRFRASASAYLNRTPTVAGNRNTWTWSNWIKRGALGAAQDIMSTSSTGTSNTSLASLFFDALGTLTFFQYTSSTVYTNLITTQVFRDPSAWYHIVVAYDDTQATAANRVKIYVNGNQITAFGTATYPTQNYTGFINQAAPHAIGRDNGSPNANYLDGYLADINFIDGQALEPYYFGNNDANGVWKPIQYKGTYGTNGFYLTFGNTTSTTTLGYDSSPNGNNWTCNNISLTAGSTYDAMTDVPTNTSATVANYAVINPLDFISANGTISSANLNWASSASGCGNRATIGSNSGKWYWEAIGSSVTSGTVGGRFAFTGSDTIAVEQDKFGMYWHPTSGIARIVNGTNTYVTSAYTYTNSDVLALALDLDNNISYWYKNGVLQYTYDFSAYSTIGARVFFPYVWNASSGTPSWVYNFGQRAFSYTPPTGYVALNTYNLPTPTILQGNKYMDATLYTGTGTALNVVNAGQFKPDLVWLKSRSQAYNNGLFDSNRGTTKELVSNGTGTETNGVSGLTAFNSNGFTLGTNPGFNESTTTFVGWQWQAGQGSTSSNTSGSVTSTTSVNTTSGFSIVTYTGPGSGGGTVGHGLGVAPKMIIVKNRSAAESWRVGHAFMNGGTNPWNYYMNLNGTAAQTAASSVWNNTAPTSTVFSIANDAGVSGSGNGLVAYCFAEIAGFSKFGFYTGNGSTDGTFVYTGFRPEFIMFKRTNDVSDWNILDATRSPYNTSITRLWANVSNAENSSAGNYDIDILSNGFKQRNTNTSGNSNSNLNGSTYIYMAFAEHPFKNANAR